jgi:CoA:oxalate CoA-transferase
VSTSARPGAAGPLRGMRVLDLSQQLPGPYATFLLASLGAAVTKIEPPAGDAARHLDPGMFERVNAGKESIRLNLRESDDRQRLHELIAVHDVLVEGFRPGVAARLGFDYPAAAAINPGLIYCSISGAGQEGPLARVPVHDLSLQAFAGAVPPEPPVTRIGVPWVDLGTGAMAALAIAAHWRGGAGAYLDMPLLDTAISWTRIKPEALDPEPTYGVVPVADGHIVIALLENDMWGRLCTALGWGDWSAVPELSDYRHRRDHHAEIRERLAAALAPLTVAGVLDLAKRHDLPIVSLSDHPAAVRDQLALRAGTLPFGPSGDPDARTGVPPPAGRRAPSPNQPGPGVANSGAPAQPHDDTPTGYRREG